MHRPRRGSHPLPRRAVEIESKLKLTQNPNNSLSLTPSLYSSGIWIFPFLAQEAVHPSWNLVRKMYPLLVSQSRWLYQNISEGSSLLSLSLSSWVRSARSFGFIRVVGFNIADSGGERVGGHSAIEVGDNEEQAWNVVDALMSVQFGTCGLWAEYKLLIFRTCLLFSAVSSYSVAALRRREQQRRASTVQAPPAFGRLKFFSQNILQTVEVRLL
jgi:hypothetical protein